MSKEKKKKEAKNVYQILIENTIECIKKYDPVKYSVDSWSDEFLKKVESENEKNFIRQVFYGTERYVSLLKSFNEVLFEKYSSQTNRQDGVFFNIMFYLIVFRFNDLPSSEVKMILQSVDCFKMNVLLQFLFDTEKLELLVKPKWIQMYDPDFIENTILKQLDLKLELNWFVELLTKINQKATGKKENNLVVQDENSQTSIQTKKHTEFVEFNLTKPKAKRIPSPIKILKNHPTQPVPDTNKVGKFQQIYKEKESKLDQIKEQTKLKYQESQVQKFKLATEERPTNIEKIKEEVELELQNKLQFNKVHKTIMPDFKDEGRVRMTVGQILQEEKKIKEKQKKEREVINNLEINLRDSSEFNNWRRIEEHKEEQQRIEQQYRKKIEMELAKDKAQEAFQDKMDENRRKAKEVKIKGELGLYEREQLLIQEMEQNCQIIEETKQQKQQVLKQRKKKEEENKEIHDQQIQAMRVLLEKKKEEEKVEKEKRDALIKQIREFEKQPRERTKGFDITECQGWGLLEEMSILELRERLEQLKIQNEKERIEKLEQRRMERDHKIHLLEDKIDLISRERIKREQENHQERERKKNEQLMREQLEQQIKEKNILTVQTKIKNKKQAKKEEEDRLEKELKEIKLKRQYLNANKAKVEAQAWKNLQDGKEREIKERQNGALIEKEKEVGRKYDQLKIIGKQKREEAEEDIKRQSDYNEDYLLSEKENQKIMEQDMAEKRQKNSSIRQFKDQHVESMRQREPYKYKVSHENLQRSQRQSGSILKNTNHNDIKLPPPQYADL